MSDNNSKHKAAGKLALAVSKLLRSASVGVPLAIGAAGVALAQDVEVERLKADIPAQTLAQSLAAVAGQTGLQFVYVSEIARDKNSKAVLAGTEEMSAGRWLRQQREQVTGKWQGPRGVPRGSIVICIALGSPADDLATELL